MRNRTERGYIGGKRTVTQLDKIREKEKCAKSMTDQDNTNATKWMWVNHTVLYKKILTSFFHVAPARLYAFARKKRTCVISSLICKSGTRKTLKTTTLWILLCSKMIQQLSKHRQDAISLCALSLSSLCVVLYMTWGLNQIINFWKSYLNFKPFQHTL